MNAVLTVVIAAGCSGSALTDGSTTAATEVVAPEHFQLELEGANAYVPALCVAPTGEVFVTWVGGPTDERSGFEVHARTSPEGGERHTWSATTTVARLRSAHESSFSLDAACGPAGSFVASSDEYLFEKRPFEPFSDVFVHTSPDGVQFDAGTQLTTDEDVSNNLQAPRIRAQGSNVVTAWRHSAGGRPQVAASSDGGSTWLPTTDVGPTPSHSFIDRPPELILGPQGRTAVVWAFFGGNGMQIHAAYSPDVGQPFESSVPLGPSAVATTAGDLWVCADGDDVSVLWFSHVEERSLQVAQSTDGGRTWAAPMTVGGPMATHPLHALECAANGSQLHVAALIAGPTVPTHQVWYTRISPDMPPLSVQVDTPPLASVRPPRVETDGEGVVLAWLDGAGSEPLSTPNHPFYVAFDAATRPEVLVGRPVAIAGPMEGGQHLDLALLDDKAFLVWAEGDLPRRLMFARFTPELR